MLGAPASAQRSRLGQVVAACHMPTAASIAGWPHGADDWYGQLRQVTPEVSLLMPPIVDGACARQGIGYHGVGGCHARVSAGIHSGLAAFACLLCLRDFVPQLSLRWIQQALENQQFDIAVRSRKLLLGRWLVPWQACFYGCRFVLLDRQHHLEVLRNLDIDVRCCLLICAHLCRTSKMWPAYSTRSLRESW